MQINEQPKEPTKEDLLDHHLREIRQSFNAFASHLLSKRQNPDPAYVDWKIVDLDHRIDRITTLIQEVVHGK